MPRFSVPLLDETGRVIGIACGSRRNVKCKTCGTTAMLECDGCDKPLCGGCSVSPRKGIDFCPPCFKPAFEHWKRGLQAIPGHRDQRRAEFREWARSESETFLRLSRPFTATAANHVGTKR